MNKASTIGIDLAKSVFQVHGVDDQGNVVLTRRLERWQVLGSSRRCRPPASARSSGVPREPFERFP